MITLFKKNETNFEHNGLGSLDKSIINPEISWRDNGAFTLEFKYPLFEKHGKEIENSSIIRANDPEGSNLFFVYKITPSMGYVNVLCYQISYKLAFNSIGDTNIVNKNGQNALTQMSSATQYPHSFTFNSDIQTTANSRVVRKNPIEFLLDSKLDNSFINRWGGHIVRHNFNIAMNSAYGSNKGYTIRHRKDLKGYEAEFDESTVVTRIRPLGYDGLLLPETYVDSPIINAYVEPRIQEIEYSDVKVKTKDTDEEGFSTPELAYAELRRLANLEFSKSKVDQPDFSAKVEFVNLKETQEYQDLRSLKEVLPGDTVKVIHADDNFNIQAQMVEYKWNPLNKSYISITLGNYTKSFTSTVSKAVNTQAEISKIVQQAQSAWTSANGKNTIYSLTYKPPITVSSVEGDLLYLKNGDKIEMWILEKVDGKLQWVLQVSDATNEELKAQMQQAQNDITDAVDSANSAVDKANASVTAIQANTQLITDVRDIANNAKTQANDAVTNAQTAVTNAQSAMSNAQNALDNYNNMVIGGRNFLLGTADPVVIIGNGSTNQIPKNIWFSKPTLADLDVAIGDGLYFSVDIEISGSNFSGIFRPRFGTTAWVNLTPDSANYSITKAEVIKWRIPLKVLNDNWLSNSRVDFRLDDVPSTVTIKATNMKLERGTKYSDWSPAPEDTIVEITNIKGELNQKVSQTNFDTLNGTVANQSTQISQNKTDIASKANQTTVNTLTGRVSTAETNINQNANDIKLKANQTDVNTITGKVSSLESSFTVQSGQITALNTKTDGQTTQIGSLQSSYNGLTSTISSVKSDLDNMVIGGTNILATTTDEKTFQGNGATNQWAILSLLTKSKLADYNLKVGDKVTFSATCEISGSGFSGSMQPRLRTSWVDIQPQQITKAEKIRYNTTITMNESRLDGGFGIDFRADNVPSTVNMKWSNLKLEIGDKATYYSPAPEEKANQIQVTQLTQDLDGFKTTVANTYSDKSTVASQINQSATAITSNVQTWTNDKLTSYSTTQQTASSITNAVANKADKSQVTQLSNQITSTVTGSTNETLISTQMISSTTLKHPNYPAMPMVEVNVTNGESYTVSSNHPNEGTDAIPTAHVWYLRLPSTVPNSNINGVYDGKSITLPASSDKIYIVFRTQGYADRFINGQYWVKVTKTPASQSQITQLASDINLRVSKGDVTSQINLESGRTLIDTKQLLLNADTVKFSGSAFIPNAAIQNLSAEKINAGTLNAANVNVINLNARALTAGTISGTNLSMNLDTGAVQFQKGYIEGAGGGVRLDLDNNYFQSLNSQSDGFIVKNGTFEFYSSFMTAQKNKMGTLSLDILNDGILFKGKKGFTIATDNFEGRLSVNTNNITASGKMISLMGNGGKASIDIGGGFGGANGIGFIGNSGFMGNLSVTGSKNAVHVTRDGLRATPAYETAESYLGDIGRSYTRENCEIWVEIDQLFSDTVNTDIPYEIFLQAYDDATFWVADFKSDKFLIKSDKPMSRFAWELKAKRRGYENERLVEQEKDNEEIEKIYGKKEV